MIKTIPDSSGPEESAFLRSLHGPPGSWSWDRPLRLAGELLWERRGTWSGLALLGSLLASVDLPLLLWAPPLHALSCGAARDQLLGTPPGGLPDLLRWGRAIPSFLALHGAVLLGLMALQASLPTASTPMALVLIGLLTLGTWTCLVASSRLAEGEKLLPSLAKSFALVRQGSPSALRLSAAQLGLVAFPASMALGLHGAGPLQLLLLLPGSLVLLWVWVGWMLWGLREQELFSATPLRLLADEGNEIEEASEVFQGIPPGEHIH